MDLQLRDKSALVTGASMGIGHAIGHAIAKSLATEDVRVAAVARRIELMEAMADKVVADGCPRPVLVRLDIMAEDAAETLRDVAYAELGRADILVNKPAAAACCRQTRWKSAGKRR
jgi:3-oxoacyl-[acyl-carrier protein] reductase